MTATPVLKALPYGLHIRFLNANHHKVISKGNLEAIDTAANRNLGTSQVRIPQAWERGKAFQREMAEIISY